MTVARKSLKQRPFASPQTIVQRRYESGRYSIKYFETTGSLSVEFTPLCEPATAFLRELSAKQNFLLDDLGKRALLTPSPFAWVEAIRLHDTDLQRRVFTSQAAIDPDVIEGMLVDDHFIGLRASLHYLGSVDRFDVETFTEYDVMRVILRSLIAGIGHQLSLHTRVITLTEREQAVIKWSAMGKISEDIAVILGLDTRQVNYAFATAARKLGTNSRVHTVVAAFKDNLIS